MNRAMLLLVFLASVLCINAVGERLTVPGDYTSIQAALDAAAPGDSVEVGPGVYEETLLFKDGVELKGAGPENTIVRTASKNGEVLKVTDAAGGSISGFRFEHSDTASLDANRKDFFDAVDVSNSSVEISNCILGPSAGCGIAVQEKSNSRVVECRAEGNSQSGIFVRGEGTEATLSRNVCSNNEWGGISLTKGSKAVAEENRCLNNNRWGVRALNRGTSIVLKNNTITGNTGPGVLIDKWGHGVVEGNTCAENENNGIVFKLAATGAVTGNTCGKNTWNGIVVQSLAADVAVHDNVCSGNKNNGITICLGAGGDVARNTCNGNTSCGIYVSSWFTAPVITENECNENGMHGIGFYCGAAGRAEGNTCRKNSRHGILVSDENTEPDIGNNNCGENGGRDVAREAGDPISRQYQVEPDETGCTLAGEHFDVVEEMADRLRRYQCRYSGGGWQLDYFYDELKKGCDDVSPKQQEVFEALLERWKQAYPESVTPFIVQAEVHAAYGWEARGGGYADTVTDEGWRVFHRELGAADRILREAEPLNSNDPQFYAAMIDIGNCLDYTTEDLQALFDKGVAIDAGYFPLYSARAWTLTHRWGGRRGELERFAEKAFERTREKYGHTLYALIAAHLATCMGGEDYVKDHFLDWKKIDAGCGELIETFPESDYYLNQHCLMACLYHDQEKAVGLFNKIGRNPYDYVWRGRSGFNRWKQWAFDMAPAPHPKARGRWAGMLPRIPFLDSARTPAVQLLSRIVLITGAAALALCAIVVFLALGYANRKNRQTAPIPKPPDPDEHPDDNQTTPDMEEKN